MRIHFALLLLLLAVVANALGSAVAKIGGSVVRGTRSGTTGTRRTGVTVRNSASGNTNNRASAVVNLGAAGAVAGVGTAVTKSNSKSETATKETKRSKFSIRCAKGGRNPCRLENAGSRTYGCGARYFRDWSTKERAWQDSVGPGEPKGFDKVYGRIGKLHRCCTTLGEVEVCVNNQRWDVKNNKPF